MTPCAINLTFYVSPPADYREVLDHSNPDTSVTVIVTSLQRAIGVAVAAAGKKIFGEKPIAMNVANCDAMIAAAQGAEVLR